MIPHCQNKQETKGKRGRPRKNQKKADDITHTDPKAYLKQRLSELMDEMFYIYEGSNEDTKPILSRASQDDCKDIDEETFYKQNKELQILLEEYLVNEEENRHKKSNDSSKPMVLQDYEKTGKLPLIETIDDDEELCQANPVKTSRTSYLTMKDPIKAFCPGSLQKLPQEKQDILTENQELIFNASSYQQQVETVIKLIYSSDRRDKSGPTAIGRLFGVTGGTIAEHYKRMQGKRRELIGRPALLDEDQLQIVELFIQQQNTKQDPPTIGQIIDFIFCSFAISTKANTLHKILKRSEGVKPVTGIPLESTRAEVPLEVIQSHYSRLEEILEYEKVPPAFVLNVDESGFQEFSDSGKQIVYVPKTYEGTETYFSVNRSAKRNTMIGCIGMDGSALIPLIVTPYKTVQRTLLLQGYGPDKCVLVQQDAGFVTSQIFAFWADHVLFPYVLQKRKLHGYEGTVILFLDGCSAHFSDYFMDECTYYGIYPIKEPPGTSDQIQQLDLGIFGIQKALQTKHIKGDYRANDKAIIEIVNSWRKATTPDNVVSAFHQSGLYVNSTSECEGYVCADISKARAVRGIQHMPCHDVIVGRQSVQIVSMN